MNHTAPIPVPALAQRWLFAVLVIAMVPGAILLAADAQKSGGDPGWHDAGFEHLAPGALAETGRVETGWEVQKTGRDVIKPRLRVECVRDAKRARSGTQCLALAIPAETAGFEFVTIGQRVQLAAGKEYEAAAWVRWPDGPDVAPSGASQIRGHRSAIVSFWARHRDGTGDFAGRDEWLFDNQWHRLTFRFRATDPAQRTLVYVSLLPNQKPAATGVLLDDFALVALDEPVEAEARTVSLALDGGFSNQEPGAVARPWHFANFGGGGIRGDVMAEGDARHFRLTMDKATSNFESAQLWQYVSFREGARYEVSCRIRWDNYAPKSPAPIVNYGIYHEDTRTWFGPVDQTLEKTGDWRTYRFCHIPPFGGNWKLYVQLNG